MTDFDQALAYFDKMLTYFDQALANFDPSDVNYFMKYTMLPNFNNLVKISWYKIPINKSKVFVREEWEQW